MSIPIFQFLMCILGASQVYLLSLNFFISKTGIIIPYLIG